MGEDTFTGGQNCQQPFARVHLGCDLLSPLNSYTANPCELTGLPPCSVVRPTLDRLGGAVATIESFTADRLFEGQSQKFFNTVHELAREADAAQRGAS